MSNNSVPAQDSEYFDGYVSNSLDSHKVMLDDVVRMNYYKDYLLSNAKGKLVIDIGGGTGILSIWAVQGGAYKVICIEASPIANTILPSMISSQSNSSNTKFNYEEIITVVPFMAEHFKTKNELFDYVKDKDSQQCHSWSNSELLIVSEWMGFYLLHEGMLDSILHIRDLFNPINNNITIFPDTANIYASPISLHYYYHKLHMSYWKNLSKEYNIDFTPLMDDKTEYNILTQDIHSPMIDIIPPDSLLNSPILMHSIDIYKITSHDLDELSFTFKCPFNQLSKHPFHTDIDNTEQIMNRIWPNTSFDGVCLWFTVNGKTTTGKDYTLSTSPLDCPTHWKQTTILLPHHYRGPNSIPPEALLPNNNNDVNMAIRITMSRHKAIDTNNNDKYTFKRVNMNRCYTIELELLDPNDI